MPEQLARSFAKERIPKPLQVSVRLQGNDFKVVYQHQYPQAVEEIVFSQRFKTREDAQEFVEVGLRARRIYRNLERDS
jgi:hypothetical protein